MRWLYDIFVEAAVWLALVPWQCGAIALGRSSREELRQRLGKSRPLPGNPRRFLLHAVSVGEMAGAEVLVRVLREREPAVTFVLSAGNSQGLFAARRLQERIPQIEEAVLLPWDRSRALLAWLSRMSPQAVVVIETEIWPNLFFACRELGVPLAIASGRMKPRDALRYRLVRPFMKRVLDCASWIGVQSEREAERFRRIGAPPNRVRIVGNLKSSAAPHAPVSPAWERVLTQGRPLIVAGSTHAPEECFLLDAVSGLRGKFPGLALLLAPRNPRRALRVARLARRRSLKTALWSDGPAAAASWDVLVLDEMGELRALYAFADVVFLGGTLVPRGGHNPWEPAAAAKPILAGSHTEHFPEEAGHLERAGALRRVRTHDDLPGELAGILSDSAHRKAMGAAARAVYEEGRGTARLHAEEILSFLEPEWESAAGRRNAARVREIG